jgi:glutamine amidotransferase
MSDIAIVDYEMGNIRSVENALRRLGAKCVTTRDPSALARASGIILPGVGAFSAAMDNLRRYGLVEVLNEVVIHQGRPFLGVCLGMQLIAHDSTELGFSEGLGWIDGHVVRMETSDNLAVPHVGWNELTGMSGPLFENLEDDAHFYFDHGFTLRCPQTFITAQCEYGGSWVAAVQHANIHAVQFHPEKSQRNGLRFLRNFLNVVESHDPC